MKSTLTTLALCVTFPILLAQTTPASKPQDPQTELANLRAENARLRAELEKTKSQLTEKSPATASTQPRAFTTMADILINTPAEIRPQATAEWYKYTGTKFDTWWKSQLVGMTFDQTLTLESAYVTRSAASAPVPKSGSSPPSPSPPNPSPTSAPITHGPSQSPPNKSTKPAQKWDAVKKGTLYRIKATIAAVDFAPDLTHFDHTKLPIYHPILHLRDVEYLPPNPK